MHVAILGPTASGKSAVAMAIARTDAAWEIVSVDSMQVYRGMDVGTAKPTPAERIEVPHHLIDIVDPCDDHDVATHQRLARAVLADVERRGKRGLLVGGTALYLRAIVDDLRFPGQFPDVRASLEVGETAELHRRLQELDPVAARRMEPSNRRRIIRALEVCIGSGQPFSSFGPGLGSHPPIDTVLVGIRWDRPMLDRRIAERYEHQLAAGFVEEVASLVADPRGLSTTASQALGYRELADHLRGRMSLSDAIELAVARTRRFARRQERWFRRDPRVRWLDGDRGAETLAAAVQELAAATAE